MMKMTSPPAERQTTADSDHHKSSAVKTLTHRVLDLVTRELNSVDTQKRIRCQVIEPLVKMLYSQMFPYVMIACAVILVILLASLCTCTMFFFFFFRHQ